MRTVLGVLFAFMLLTTASAVLAVDPPPSGEPPPGGSVFLAPGNYYMHFSEPEPEYVPDPSTLEIGETVGFCLINGGNASKVNPPPGYEDYEGNLWYFYPDGTFIMLSSRDSNWYGGTYRS